MKNKTDSTDKAGSTKTVIIAVLAVTAVVFSLLSLIGHKRSVRNPRENMEMMFECAQCREVFSMKVIDMHERMREGSNDIVMGDNEARVKCPECEGWAVLKQDSQ